MSEQVLVIPANKINSFQGFSENVILNSSFFSFMDRDKAETDENFKQIIPYAFFRYKDSYFVYQRAKISESRLEGAVSLGIGGHINPIDVESSEIVEAALKREIYEELNVDALYDIYPVGMINDDSNSVGRVHLGVAYEVVVSSPQVECAENGLITLGFYPIEELQTVRNKMETWSQIIFDRYIC